MKAPEDEYTATFRFLTRRGDDADARACGDLVRSWLVKLFFLPLMLTWLMQQATWFINQDLIGVVVALRLLLTDGDVAQHFPQIFEYLHRGLFLLDLVIAAVGYCLTIKIMGAHVRSTERTALGWAVALACYPPFNLALTNAYINYYGNDLFWQDWLAHSPSLLLAWGVAILVLEALYVWATIPFGLRFSNLTNRGIITQGPYRFTKHPAYIAKNLSWWLLAIPFVTNPSNGYGWSEAIRHSILLLAWNGIYFMRARTEERHLHSDPHYGHYARIMDIKSVFAWCGRLMPSLRYGNGRLFSPDRKD